MAAGVVIPAFVSPFCTDLPSGPAYNSAGDFLPRVAGWLCHEIVRTAVDHNVFSNDAAHPETVCQHLGVCSAVIAEQRRKVSVVFWVFRTLRVIMSSCV